MVEVERTCANCVHHDGCLERFRAAKAEGFYDSCSEEEYFSYVQNCDFYYANVKPGEWIKAECSEKDGDATCSICNHWAWSDSKYCPNCGAKMKGGAE